MEAGYNKPICRVSLTDKADLVSLITTYHLFIKVKAHMDCSKEGLELSVCTNMFLSSLCVDLNIPLTAIVNVDVGGGVSDGEECVLWFCFLS